MSLSQAVARPGSPGQAAGAGSLALSVAQHSGKRPALVVDEAVVESARRLVHREVVNETVVRRPVGWDDVQAIAAALVDAGADSVIAVGGGNALDAAKLASVCAGSAPARSFLLDRMRFAGFVALPHDLWRPLPVVAAPSTLGTGSEVSAVACCELREAEGTLFKCLVSLPCSPATAVAYEPELLGAPRHLVRAGAAEMWTRVLGAAVSTDSQMSWANAEAESLVVRTARMAHEAAVATADRVSGEGLVSWAMASAASHLGWALRGRGIAPFPLWFVANELSIVCGVTKMEAISWLIPGWVGAVADGDSTWGDATRMARMLQLSGLTAPDAFVKLVRTLVPAPDLDSSWPRTSDIADVVAERVGRRFGAGRPMSRRHTPGSVASLVRRAGLQATAAVR